MFDCIPVRWIIQCPVSVNVNVVNIPIIIKQFRLKLFHIKSSRHLSDLHRFHFSREPEVNSIDINHGHNMRVITAQIVNLGLQVNKNHNSTNIIFIGKECMLCESIKYPKIRNIYSSSLHGLWVNSPWGWRPNGLLTHEGKRNNCFSRIQLVDQKYRNKTT